MRKLNQIFGDKKCCSSYWLGWMFATARKIKVKCYLFIYRFNSVEKSSCFTTQPFLDLVQDRWAAGQTSYKLSEYKINRKLLSGRRSSLMAANILGEVNNRTTFQISRPSLRDSHEKVYTPSVDADESNSLIPLNMSTSAWNCFFFLF